VGGGGTSACDVPPWLWEGGTCTLCPPGSDAPVFEFNAIKVEVTRFVLFVVEELNIVMPVIDIFKVISSKITVTDNIFEDAYLRRTYIDRRFAVEDNLVQTDNTNTMKSVFW